MDYILYIIWVETALTPVTVIIECRSFLLIFSSWNKLHATDRQLTVWSVTLLDV